MYDSKPDTIKHIMVVNLLMSRIIKQLVSRARHHDETKLKGPEKEAFDLWTPKLSRVTYGTDEYREMLTAMGPALDHHKKVNRHHPEFHKNGVEDMNLIDLVEMICDWKAATLRHDDGDINRSLQINAKRFGIPEAIVKILENTINDHCFV